MDEKELLSLIQQSEATDLAVLIQAKETAKRNLLDENTTANIAAFQRAGQALKDFQAQGKEDELKFKHRKEALVFLQREGYKIKQTKLYMDAKNGLLKMQPDGSITEKDLNRYIRRARLVKPAHLADHSPIEALHQQEKEIEIKKKGHQADNLEFDLQVKKGRYIMREDHYLELASRAAALEAHLRYNFHLQRTALVEKILKAIDQQHREQVIEDGFNAFLDQALTDFANLSNYHVIFIADATSD